jgi:diguanylate cyclase (GGDEF)-like protein
MQRCCAGRAASLRVGCVKLDVRGRDELDEAFWLSHMRVGFGVFIAECVAVLVYLRASPSVTNQPALIAIAAGGAGVGLLTLLGLGRIARRSWRVRFSLVWSLSCGWALAECAHLDGGIDSPLLYLLLFPVIYAALAYRPRAVVLCGISMLAQLVVVCATDHDITSSRSDLFMIAAVVVGMTALAVAASIYRDDLQRSEALLLREIAALADTDGLTGCLNHRAFHEHLAVEIDRAVRYDRPLSLVVVDIDDFKAVNDTYGHPFGDDALVAVAAALQGELRRSDVVGRVGGDEFAIVLSDTAIDGAETHARRVTRTLDRRPEPRVGVSIGMAALDPAEPSAAQLLRDADRALYHVKDTGRHGIGASSPGGALIRLVS